MGNSGFVSGLSWVLRPLGWVALAKAAMTPTTLSSGMLFQEDALSPLISRATTSSPAAEMVNFPAALKVVLSHEGGYVNRPNDKGGPTNAGITQATLDAWLGGHGRPTFSVEQLDAKEIANIYYELYWTPLGLDHLSDTPLATAIFDMAVLRGVPSVVRALQHVLEVNEDGRMGPHTAIALQTQGVSDPRKLGVHFLQRCQWQFCNLVAKDITQVEFLDGWISRTQDLMKAVVL